MRIEPDFFSDFASHVDATVYGTDGCFGVTGAHEIYFNKQAREIAPVRLTGNYGSEILRGVSQFKPLKLSPSLFALPFRSAVDRWVGSVRKESQPVSFAAFREVPWRLFGSLAAARSQVSFRTPYLDNEIVALAYQAPESFRASPVPSWRLVQASSAALSRIPTDRRPPPNSSAVAGFVRRFFSEITFKLDYFNTEGWPNSFLLLEPFFRSFCARAGILGLHKFLHYRNWFRRELASYVRDALMQGRVRQSPFWNARFLEQMVTDHIGGRKNYVYEINAVMTLEAVERLLLEDLAPKRGLDDPRSPSAPLATVRA